MSRDIRAMWLFGEQSIKITYHPVTFGGYRQLGSGDVIFLVCRVILQDPVIKDSSNSMSRSPLKVSYHSAKFGVHIHTGSGDNVFHFSRDLARQHDERVM